MTRKVVYCLLLLLAAAVVPAQGRWQLGNPSLIIDMPADPASGGVAWHDRGAFAVLPTSWSAESADLRVEVAEIYTTETAQTLAGKIAGKLGIPASGTAGQVSGFPSYRVATNGKHLLAVAASGRGWVVVATAKTSGGMAAAPAILNSVVLERWGSPRWVRRSVGNTRMIADLPYEMAAQVVPGGTALDYELHFDDFAVEAWLSEAGEGKEINYEGTIKTYLDAEKSKSSTTDFKSQRQKVSRGNLKGDVVTLEFKRGTKSYKIRSFFAMDGGKLLRLSAVGRGERPAHDQLGSKIMESVAVAGVNLANFAPREIPGQGIWLDINKDFEPLKDSGAGQTTGVFGGSYALDVRITPTTPGVPHNGDQLMQFAEAKQRGAHPDGKDFRVETSRRLVDGIETRLMKMRFKGKGRGDDTCVYALAVLLPDRIVLAEMIAEEQQSPYLDRIVDTVKIELSPPAGWTRWSLGEAGFSMLFGKQPEEEKLDPEGDLLSQKGYVLDNEGVIALVVESKYKSDPPMTAVLVRDRFEQIKRNWKISGRIVEQQPLELANASGVRVRLTMDIQGGTRDLDLIILKRGSYAWSMTAFSSPAASAKLAVLINSLR